MQKTLFKKYLRVSVAIVLVSFLILGMMLIVFISQYWENDKRDLLSKNARNVAWLAENNVNLVGSNAVMINKEVMQSFMVVLAQSIGGDIFITDLNGETLLCSDNDESCPHFQKSVPQAVVKVASLSAGYAGTSTLGGVYDYQYYVVGVPITAVNVTGESTPIGVVFTAFDARDLAVFRSDVLRMFLFAAIAAFFISLCAVGLFSYNMVKPLRHMASAARSFGAGDFTKRVPVSGNDEIGELAVAFNNMADSLSASEGMRRSFIANVSHELKTPMTTIAGFIDGILDGTIPPEKQKHYLRIVSDEVKRLSRLVQSMLALSRIDSGALKLNKQRFDLTNTVLSTLLTFEQKIEARRIEVQGLEEAESLYIDGDPDMIHQVVYNLIENAVKFTNQGGAITISIADAPSKATVRIRNTGQGIPADEIGYIFDRFYKTDKSRSQDKNGMGLGLYIVKTILKQHGGDITVSSVEGEYCEFEFWLPKIVMAELAPGDAKK